MTPKVLLSTVGPSAASATSSDGTPAQQHPAEAGTGAADADQSAKPPWHDFAAKARKERREQPCVPNSFSFNWQRKAQPPRKEYIDRRDRQVAQPTAQAPANELPCAPNERAPGSVHVDEEPISAAKAQPTVVYEGPVTAPIAWLDARARTDASALTEQERAAYMHILPRSHRRHLGITAPQLLTALRDGSVGFVFLAHCRCRELNERMKDIVLMGELQLGRRLLERMLLHGKANSHTLASYFEACFQAGQPRAAFEGWRNLARVRSPPSCRLRQPT